MKFHAVWISSNLACGGGADTVLEKFEARCHRGRLAWYLLSFPKGQWGEACTAIDASRANERPGFCNIAWYICFSPSQEENKRQSTGASCISDMVICASKCPLE
jgi:hypothetical protein